MRDRMKSNDFSWVSKYVKDNAQHEIVTESVSTDRSPKDFEDPHKNQHAVHNQEHNYSLTEVDIPLKKTAGFVSKESKDNEKLLKTPLRNLNSLRAIHDKHSGSNPRSINTSYLKERPQLGYNPISEMQHHATFELSKDSRYYTSKKEPNSAVPRFLSPD